MSRLSDSEMLERLEGGCRHFCGDEYGSQGPHCEDCSDGAIIRELRQREKERKAAPGKVIGAEKAIRESMKAFAKSDELRDAMEGTDEQ